ncbi:MAG: FtsX-like permease family protein [Adlercreutzia equolifaciens]
MAAYQSFGNDAPIFYGYFDSADGDHGALAEELATAGSAYFHDKSPYELAFYSFNDYIEQRDSNQMIATVVNVFCLLFAVILALIAMANVFNTVTNSLILRRREFAVMKSVGLSNRQFRAMVAEECVAWCVRGLVPGVLLSLFVSFLLWQVISGSMTGLPFTLPWSYVALAAAMTVVAVGASVASRHAPLPRRQRGRGPARRRRVGGAATSSKAGEGALRPSPARVNLVSASRGAEMMQIS